MNIENTKENLLLIRPDINDAQISVEKNPEDAINWYKYGVAIGNSGDRKKAIEIFSKGIHKHPTEAYLYFGLGRQYSGIGDIESAGDNFEKATEINPGIWTFWYYRATNLNLRGYYKQSIDYFLEAINRTDNHGENGPMVHWIYSTYVVDLEDKERALESLKLYPSDAIPPQMDYGYDRSLRLYKGELTTKNFIDLNDMKEKCLNLEGRIQLELNTMYYALFVYRVFHNDYDKAKEALLKLNEIKISGAFGYLKGQKYFDKYNIK